MRLFRLLSSLSLVAPALAQTPYDFELDPQASSFTWTGDSSVGPIVGNPHNDFMLVGNLILEVDGSGGQAIASMRFVDGDALVTPDIAGKIPNPFPFLPPLAEVDIAGLRLSASSPTTGVSPGGAFTASVTLTVLSGILTVAPLGSTPTMQDLTGSQSEPTDVTGNLVHSAGVLSLAVPVSIVFSIDDASSGISADITLNGDLVGDFVCPSPANYCSSAPNSAGPGAVIGFAGTTSLFANDFALLASGLPVGQPGVFYFGPQAVSQPFGNGTRCVGGAVVRLSPNVSDGNGEVTRSLDLTGLPIPAGETRFYQFWYRDPLGGGAVFNLTDGLEVFLCP